jgi:hypothetical protein
MSKRSTSRRGREEWREIIARQESGGSSVPKYCREQNINEKSFYAWRKRLGQSPGPKLKGFIEVSPAAVIRQKTLCIKTPEGYSVEVPQGADGSYVKTIITVLASL